MSHDIMEKDQMVSIEVPWHGLGKRISAGLDTRQAVVEAGLDFLVEKVQLYAPTSFNADGEPMGHVTVPGAFCTRVVGDTEPLGFVGDDYTVVQNDHAFSIGDALINGGAHVITAGSLLNRRKVWMLFDLKNEFEVLPGDIHQQYIMALSSHDGSQAVTWGTTNVQVVCHNTYRLANSQDNRTTYRFLHTTNVKEAMEEGKAFLKWSLEAEGRTLEMFREMTRKQLLEEQAERFLLNLFPDKFTPLTDTIINGLKSLPNGDEIIQFMRDRGGMQASGPVEARKRIRELVAVGPNADVAGDALTPYNLFNAVTRYVDHEMGTKAPDTGGSKAAVWAENRMMRTQFGAGQLLKSKALDLAASYLSN